MTIEKLAIVGSRTFNTDKNYAVMCATIDKIRKNNNVITIVSGGARGADSLAERYADENKLEKKIFKPDHSGGYHPSNYARRNKKIVNYADYVIAFWDGKSKGTKMTINFAKERDVGVKIIIIKNEI